jgi:AmmeMemoRadiSam system protein A
VFVASGDLSHKLKADGPYGYASQGPVFDREATEAMASGDFSRFLSFDEDFCDAAAECGRRSFLIMAGTLDGLAVRSELLSYEGPFGVGYGVAAFTPTGETDPERRFGRNEAEAERRRRMESKSAEDAFVRLARLSLETYVRSGKRLARPDELPAELTERRAGVFVSLKKDGRLRGCIGTIAATTADVASEIIQNAVSAGTGDPRFEPVRENELDSLVYSVDVLGDPEPIATATDLDPKRYGVIVRKGARCGLLLPNLEGIDRAQEQVEIALRKGGIAPTEHYSLERFEVVRHH